MSEPATPETLSASAPEAVTGQPRNMHGFMAFGISSMALVFGTAGVGIVSVLAHLGLPPGLYKACVAASNVIPLLLAALGVRHGVRAFVLAKRGIPCYKESEFAAFLGIVIGLAVAGIFVWFGFLSGGAPPRPA